MKTILIVIDSLRFDEAPSIEGLVLRKCVALASNTESSLATILSGLSPEEHGITRIGQPNAPQLLERIRDRLLPSFFKRSFIASPAIIFHRFFTRSTHAKYCEEVFPEAARLQHSFDFILLHEMSVHDYRDMGLASEFYAGFEPIPREALGYRGSMGLRRPVEGEIQCLRDAGWLKAKYRGAVKRVFTQLTEFLRLLRDWRIIVTSDHGESFTFFHHDGVPDPSVYEVPLYTNFELEDKTYTHLDVYRMVRE